MVVLLQNGSTGKVTDTKSDVVEVGTEVRIELQDENGNLINQVGIIAEILEE